eukprot:1368195-Rhodomonas_salina.2
MIASTLEPVLNILKAIKKVVYFCFYSVSPQSLVVGGAAGGAMAAAKAINLGACCLHLFTRTSPFTYLPLFHKFFGWFVASQALTHVGCSSLPPLPLPLSCCLSLVWAVAAHDDNLHQAVLQAMDDSDSDKDDKNDKDNKNDKDKDKSKAGKNLNDRDLEHSGGNSPTNTVAGTSRRDAKAKSSRQGSPFVMREAWGPGSDDSEAGARSRPLSAAGGSSRTLLDKSRDSASQGSGSGALTDSEDGSAAASPLGSSASLGRALLSKPKKKPKEGGAVRLRSISTRNIRVGFS